MFDDEEGKREREELANSLGSVLDDAENVTVAAKRLRFFVIADALFLILSGVASSWIAELVIETYLYLTFLAFSIGFFIAFTALRFYQKTSSTVAEFDSIESGIMGGYSYKATQDRKWTMWLIATAAGGVNAIAFIAIVGIFG